MKSLLLDDMRNIYVDKVCRDIMCAKMALMGDTYDILYLDHDLGTFHTGYDFIKWAIENDVVPKKVVIVSSNPVGRDNIANALVSYGFRKINPYTLEKK